MKTITITYDTQVITDKRKAIGETCIDITLMDDVAERLIQTGESGVAIKEIEKDYEKMKLSCEKFYNDIDMKAIVRDVLNYSI